MWPRLEGVGVLVVLLQLLGGKESDERSNRKEMEQKQKMEPAKKKQKMEQKLAAIKTHKQEKSNVGR